MEKESTKKAKKKKRFRLSRVFVSLPVLLVLIVLLYLFGPLQSFLDGTSVGVFLESISSDIVQGSTENTTEATKRNITENTTGQENVKSIEIVVSTNKLFYNLTEIESVEVLKNKIKQEMQDGKVKFLLKDDKAIKETYDKVKGILIDLEAEYLEG